MIYQTNLLPPIQKKKLKTAKINKLTLQLAVGVVFLLGILSGIIFILDQKLKTDLQTYQKRITLIQQENKEGLLLEKEISEFRTRDRIIKDLEKERIDWYSILSEVINRKMSSIKITNMAVDENQKFSLTGTANSRGEIVQFKDNLEASSYFEDVNFQSSTLTKPEIPQSKADFSLSFNLEKK